MPSCLRGEGSLPATPDRAERPWWRGVRPLEFLAIQRNLAGLVARQELLRARHPEDAELKLRLRRGILLQQLGKGSWGGSLGWTALRLGQLWHLGMGLADEPVRRAVDWIYERQLGDGSFAERDEVVNSYATVIGDEMPFSRRGPDITALALAPLLALGAGVDAPVHAALAYLKRQYRGGKRCCARCTANLVRTLSFSPEERESDRVASGLAWLASVQRDGGWRAVGGPEFYFILDAVGRLEHPIAEQQVRAALPALRRLMQHDGGWGVACRAEKTLAVCRALCGPTSDWGSTGVGWPQGSPPCFGRRADSGGVEVVIGGVGREPNPVPPRSAVSVSLPPRLAGFLGA